MRASLRRLLSSVLFTCFDLSLFKPRKENVCNAVKGWSLFLEKTQGVWRWRNPPQPSQRYAVGEQQQAKRKLGAATARGLGGSTGLRWQSVLH